MFWALAEHGPFGDENDSCRRVGGIVPAVVVKGRRLLRRGELTRNATVPLEKPSWASRLTAGPVLTAASGSAGI
jgi:hypothetical protein